VHDADELEDWEYPAPDDTDDDASETIACPACNHPVYEDAVKCPHCGTYITIGATSVFAGRPWWFVILASAGIAAVIAWLLI
jgi:hypothetical protein